MVVVYRWGDTKAAPLHEAKYLSWVQAQALERLECDFTGAYPVADWPFTEIVRLVTHSTGKRFLIARHWRLERASIRGIDCSAYWLRYFCDARVRKDDSLGAYSGEHYDSRLLMDAHEAWIQAGKPDEFTFVS